MPEITLRGKKKEVIETLPMVCMVCGDDADVEKATTFSYTPPGAWAMFRLIGAIIAAMYTKKMKIEMPLCQKHANPWLGSTLATGGLLAIFLGGLLVMGILAGYLPERNGRDMLIGIFAVTWVLGMICLGIVAGILSHRAIRSLEIDDHRIRLTNVSQDFIDAFQDLDEEPPARDRRSSNKIKRVMEDEDDEEDEPRSTGIRKPKRDR